jgi:hypothetical protein
MRILTTIMLATTLLGASAAIAACVSVPLFVQKVVGSGNQVTRQMDVRDFTGIDASGAFRVNVVAGDAYSVAVTADDNLFEYIEVRKVGSTLRIGFNTMHPISLGSGSFKADIVMPSLESIGLSGASQANISGFKTGKDFNADLSGASGLIGSLDAARIQARASGASRVQLQGSAGDLSINGSGASNIDLSGLKSGSRSSVELSGASQAAVPACESLEYSLSGASHLAYKGAPRIERSQSSGGSSISNR